MCRHTATKKGAANSDNPTAKTAQQCPQGAHQTTIRPLIYRISECAILAACQQLPTWGRLPAVNVIS